MAKAKESIHKTFSRNISQLMNQSSELRGEKEGKKLKGKLSKKLKINNRSTQLLLK